MTPASPPLSHDDFVTWLSRSAAWRDLPPRLVTVSVEAAPGSMDGVLGPATAVVIAPEALIHSPRATASASPRAPGDSTQGVEPHRHAVVARFLASDVLEAVIHARPDWIAACAALIAPPSLVVPLRQSLARLGFTTSRTFASPGRAVQILTRPEPSLPTVPANPTARRPALEHLVIVDPCLGTGRGHYLGHARMLTAGAVACGARVTWAAQAGLAIQEVAPGADIRRDFRRCFIDLDKQGAVVDLSAELFTAWLAVADAFDQPGAHLLMHSADAHMLRAVAKLLIARPNYRGAIHLLLHVDPRRLAGRALGEEVHRTIVRMRRSPAWGETLFLWAENRRLAGWLGEWLQATVPTAPALTRLITCEQPSTGDPLRLAVLGESRASKGFLDLPDLAQAVAAEPVIAERVRLLVQWWPPVGRPLNRHEEAVARLRTFPFIEIAEGAFSEADYQRRLAEADAVLLPYDPELYRLRGSGVVLEALAQGLMVIVRAGSALEIVAAEGVVFTFRRPEDLPEILRRVLAEPRTLRERARRRAERFRRLNGPERFVRALDQRARGAGPFAASRSPSASTVS